MGDVVETFGKAEIRPENRRAFIRDILKVADQGGLFGCKRVSVFDRELDLITFPDENEDDKGIAFSKIKA